MQRQGPPMNVWYSFTVLNKKKGGKKFFFSARLKNLLQNELLQWSSFNGFLTF
jgi:hypothetical protein